MSRERLDSQQAWLGKVPREWKLAPLGNVFRERKVTVSDTDYSPLSVSMQGILPRMENVALTANGDARKLVRAGDYVINSRSDRKGSGGIAPTDGSVSVISTVLEPRGIEPAFAHHLLRSTAFQEEFYRWGSGIVDDLWSTRYPAMRRITLALPPLTEQRTIADYLDRETAKIDTLIEKQTTMIERLRERRAGVVSSAVVAGIQGETLAPTGDDWFPELNQRWKMRRLHYGFDVRLGKMLDGAKWTEVDAQFAPYLRAANVQPGGLDLSDIKEMPFTVGELARLDLRADDLLVVEGGSVGVAYRISEDLPGWSFQKTLNRVRTRRAESTRYLAYAFLHLRSAGVFELVASGSTFTHLTAEKLRAVRFPVPPLDEQREIADYLDRETAKIDTLIAKVERHIELAKERRAALITAAVTGQIDVTKDAE